MFEKWVGKWAGAKRTWGRRHTVLSLCFLAVVIGYTDRINISVASVAMAEEFGWSHTIRGTVLSSFFVGYMLFLVPSGWLSIRFGGKRVLAVAIALWSAFTLLTPFAASISISALISIRIALGFAEAALFPATTDLLSRWAPPQERTRAVAWLFSGVPLGQIFGLMMTGWIVAIFEWPMAFYLFGPIGFVWIAVWLRTVVDDPAEDTRISPEELRTLQEHPTTPPNLRSNALFGLLAHVSVWAIVVSHFCSNWGLYFLLAWLPSYFREVHQLSVANASLFSTAPWLAAFVTANLSAVLSDRAIARGVPVTRVRKVTLGLSLLSAAIFLILCRNTEAAGMALLLICCATGALGAAWSGFGPNVLDISPTYAPIIGGFSNFIATVPGIVGVALTGWLVDTTGTYASAFVLTASICIGGALFYIAFGRATRVDVSDEYTSPSAITFTRRAPGQIDGEEIRR